MRKLSKKISNYLFWNNVIVAIFETILIIAFVSLIKVKHHMSFISYGESFESYLTIIVSFGYIFIPLLAFFQLMRKFSLVNEKGFKKTYGALYENLDTRKGKKVLLEPFSFLFRRVFIAFIVIYGNVPFIWQITMVFVILIIHTAIPFLVQSQQSSSDRQLFTFNEMQTLFIAHTFIIFNMVSLEDNFLLGYWLIIIVAVYCLCNFLLILRYTFLFSKFRCKVYMVNKKYKKYRQQLKRNLNITQDARRQHLYELRQRDIPQLDSLAFTI